jgi:anti-anti-sigma factor
MGSEVFRGMERRRTARRGIVYQDKQLVIRQSSRPAGLRLIGEVNASNVEAVGGVLNTTLQASAGGDLHVDVTGLEFSDVSGIRVLVAAAEGVDGTRRLILYGLPPLMSKVMHVVGWTDLPALTISESEFPNGDEPSGRESI